ncbi:MAG: ribulose-phosphate 3-epimerase [Clostridia bacterium]|nr:ribulose-phosphate 3-epimerase [Clostridia bacterium]
MIKISPSVLASDLSNLASEVVEIEKAGAEMAHLDVMDGVFVANMSFGMPVIECLRNKSNIIFDVHLMIVHPEKYAKRFIDAGADIVTFHIEACDDPRSLLREIRAAGAKAAISVKPATPASAVFDLLDELDMVLVMTVEPGYGGQKFMADMLPKIKELRAEIERRGLDIDIQVDGGINPETAKLTVEAGANVLVAGSSVFRAADRKAAIDALR